MDMKDWIPVAEGLPKKDGDVIVCSEDGYVCMTSCYDGHFNVTPSNMKYEMHDVVAWMPKPPVYLPGLKRFRELYDEEGRER